MRQAGVEGVGRTPILIAGGGQRGGMCQLCDARATGKPVWLEWRTQWGQSGGVQ